MSHTVTGPTPLSTRFLRHLTDRMAGWSLVEPEVAGLECVVRAGDSVLDVGAAYGMYTLPLARIVGPAGRVLSFEPQTRQRRILAMMRTLLRLRNIKVDGCALGSTSGEKSFVLPTSFGIPLYGHAHVAAGAADGPARTSRRRAVAVRTVDDACRRWDVDSVAFMKLDVEGFELDVVLGAARIIDRSRPSILLEIEDRHTARYGHAAADVVAHILTSWPEYRMYTWLGGVWERAHAVEPATRNYLFATTEALRQ